MHNINNRDHDYKCQLSCDNNKMGKCQLYYIQFINVWGSKDDKGICLDQDLTEINKKRRKQFGNNLSK